MGKISNTSSYPNAVPANGDMLIFTDVSDNNNTKTCKFSQIDSSILYDSYTWTMQGSEVYNLFSTTPGTIIRTPILDLSIPDNSVLFIHRILLNSQFVNTAYPANANDEISIHSGQVSYNGGAYQEVAGVELKNWQGTGLSAGQSSNGLVELNRLDDYTTGLYTSATKNGYFNYTTAYPALYFKTTYNGPTPINTGDTKITFRVEYSIQDFNTL
jgi:hypothetical protein